MFEYQLFSLMYSPQPPAMAGQALSASQRGANKLLTPFFCLQEKSLSRSIGRAWGDEYMERRRIFKVLIIHS